VPFTVLAGAAAVAAAIPLLVYSLVSGLGHSPARPAGARPVADMHQLALSQSASDRVLRPFVSGVARRVRRIAPAGWAEALDRKIWLAGAALNWPLERVIAAKAVLGLVGAGGAFVFLGSTAPVSRLGVAALTGFLGFFTPDILLGSRGRERQLTIQHELPDALDQMTMSVEAGLGFEAAVARVAKAGEGPLAEELTFALQEMQIGVPRHEALRNMAARTDVPDLRNFVFTVIQSEAYGLPIAQILRVQAGELRMRRRQRAEEQAMKIPVKIIFPLLFCIFPSLFIVLLGPAAIRIWRSLVGT